MYSDEVMNGGEKTGEGVSISRGRVVKIPMP